MQSRHILNPSTNRSNRHESDHSKCRTQTINPAPNHPRSAEYLRARKNQILISTCGSDPFTSGPKAGLGRWGMFMDPRELVIGMPDASVGARYFDVSVYAADGTRQDLFWVSNDGHAAVNGDLRVSGEITEGSDRNLKENFAPVDSREILEKVAVLPVSGWNYKRNKDSRHIGPMAQDFRAAFGLGSEDTSICTVDADGVALMAIQGLNQKVETDNAALRAENAELRARLEKLEQLINARSGGGQ